MDEHSDHQKSGWSTIGRWVFCGFILVGGFFLITEHSAHLFGILPYLLLAACPLMHFFHHHGGHEHHDENQHERDVNRDSGPGFGNTPLKHDYDH